MTLDGSSAGWNRVLSNLDKVFVMRCYPKEGIQRTTQDGIYLVNRVRGNQRASGIAYYEHFGNNDGQQPDDYAEVDNGDFTWWENGGVGMSCFPSSFLHFIFMPSFFPLSPPFSFK